MSAPVAPAPVQRPRGTGRPSPLAQLAATRTRSYSLAPPSSPPATYDGDALERPSSTPPRARSSSSASSTVPELDTTADSSIEVIIEPPSSAASTSDSRPASPVGPLKPQNGAVTIQAPPAHFAPSPGKCFQEQIQPLAYFDVLHPAFVSHPGAAPFNYPIASSSLPGHIPGFFSSTFVPQPTYYEPQAPICGYTGAPLTPLGSSHAVDQPFGAVQPASTPHSAPHQFHEGSRGAPEHTGWLTPSGLFSAAHSPVSSPPASPGLSDDGSAAWSLAPPSPQLPHVPQQQQAKPMFVSTSGTVYPPHSPSAYPPVPTLRDLLDSGEHFFSSGTCKFFDVAKGYGFLIDDHAEDLGADVFVHYTGIDMHRGFRCLAHEERVEYILTKHTSGRFQALRVKGEFGVPLKGLSDERNAEIARRAHGRREASSSPSGAEVANDATLSEANARKPRVLPAAAVAAVKQQQSQQASSHGLGAKARSPLAPRTA